MVVSAATWGLVPVAGPALAGKKAGTVLLLLLGAVCLERPYVLGARACGLASLVASRFAREIAVLAVAVVAQTR